MLALTPRARRRPWPLLPLCLLLALPLAGQAPGQTMDQMSARPPQNNVVLDPNQSLFVVLAAINAGGYDQGLGQPGGSPLRLDIRASLLAQKLPVVAELRDYYAAHKLSDPSQDLAQYISLALFVGAPPEMRLTVAPQDLPPDAAELQDFLPLLRRFYVDDNLAGLWQRQQAVCQAPLDADAAGIRKLLMPVDTLLRLPQNATGRSFFVLPDPLIPPGQINARAYKDNYYIVTGLDTGAAASAIRHTYLQFVLDPLVASLPVAVEQTQVVLALAQRAPALAPEVKSDGTLFYTECMVRAIEIQLDPGTPEQKKQQVDQAMAEGLLLTRYWFDTLTAYRKDVVNFREFYPDAAFAIPVHEVEDQGKHEVFAAAATTTSAPHAIRMVSLLQSGEDMLQANNLNGVEALAQASLQSPSDHATAHFLLALAALHKNTGAEAQQNFTLALAEATPSDRHVKTWSNIYLGRMADIRQSRDEAVAHYKSALDTADTESERALARAGIAKPYQNPATGRGQ